MNWIENSSYGEIDKRRTARDGRARARTGARARRAKPGANAPARRSAAPAAPGTLLTRVRVIPAHGWGWAGRCNRAAPPNPNPPPPHPRQHKPYVDVRLSDHIRKPSRSTQPRVAPFSAPRAYCHFSFCLPGSVMILASSGSAGSSSGSSPAISCAASAG